ncbi:hypothetical protein DL96DRAFT_1817984 [Flagelloscypha sp. PMI_526]|nr:hypothetical protein DL96DRAFT_1817984 [Flagelloscypha sp. PMI_526]
MLRASVAENTLVLGPTPTNFRRLAVANNHHSSSFYPGICLLKLDDQARELHRIPDLWFSDGGIVFQAGHSIFRIYQGILSARCAVFRDMFTKPPSSFSTNEMYDGCPLILLPDDATELEWFLRSIFDSTSFSDDAENISYRQVAGILRLSHKYDCPELKRRALIRFASTFRCSKDFHHDPRPPPSRRISFRTADHFDFVPLCLEVDAPWLLPRSYQILACNTTALEMTATRKWADQYPALLITFLKGIRLHTALFNRLIWTLSFPCPDRDGDCQKLIAFFVDHIHTRLFKIPPDEQGLPYPLRKVIKQAGQTFTHTTKDLAKMGSICKSRISRVFESVDRAEWSETPEFYGLGTWDELMEMKEKALRPGSGS